MLTMTMMLLILLAAMLIAAHDLRKRRRVADRLQSRLIRALHAEIGPGAGLLFRGGAALSRPGAPAMARRHR